MLRQALAYAAAWWPVFPCKPDGTPKDDGWKAPLTEHGFCDAATDPRAIRAWWARWPNANVALATGAPGPDVLDVDVKPDGSGWAAFNRLRAAGLLNGARALVRTPSGGLHAYYAGTRQPSGRLVRHYLDFKAAGGYVVAPPSMVGGRPYELLDRDFKAAGRVDWQAARRLLDPPRPPARPGRGAGCGALAAWVAGLREGNRNDGLFWAACRMAEQDSPTGDLEQLVAAAVQAGLPEDEARRTVASAARKAAAR
jgi:Bifunctional DNA primase/polymerase, N-terminal/Primase C terminal 1 (PriCT-1)